MSAKKEKQQEQLKEKEKEKNNVNKYLIDLLHSSEFLFFSTFDYEKDEQIETVNLFPLMLNDNKDVINKNNILNQLLALNITTQSTIEDIEKLNDKYIYLGYRLVILDEIPLDKDLYGYVVFETDKEWTEYFNIIGSENCLFIHHLDNKKTIDYSNTYTIIKTAKPIYIYFEKVN